LHKGLLVNIECLFGAVELDEASQSSLALQRVELGLMQAIDVLNVTPTNKRNETNKKSKRKNSQPIVDHTERPSVERCTHATALVVTTHNHMIHLEHFYSILNHRQARNVGVHHHAAWMIGGEKKKKNKEEKGELLPLLGDVSMHKKFAHTNACEQFGRHTRIAAANEEKFRTLALGHALKELWVFGDRFGAPLFIVSNNPLN
jgi:hypothetical protein